MKKKLLIFFAALQLFCGTLFLLPQQGTGSSTLPKDEEISEEEFAKLVEQMVQEIEKEIKKEEETQRAKEEAKETPKIEYPTPKPVITSTNKKTNLYQSWVPTKTEETLPQAKKEAINFYLTKLMDKLSLIQESLSSLSSYEKEKFAPYKIDINKTVSYLGQIKDNEIYLISLYNEKFKNLRENLLRFSEELEKINLDVKIKTDEEEIAVEELYEAAQKETTEKFEADIEEKIIKQPSTPKTKKVISKKKEIVPYKIEDQKAKKSTPLSWYQKLLNWIFNSLKATWNYIVSLFTNKKEGSQPIKKEIPQNSQPEEKPSETDEKESPDEFLKLMKVMQEGLRGIEKEKAADTAKPRYPRIAKMAWKKFLKLLQQGELKKLNDQFKAALDFSTKAIEEERKKEEEKVKKAEEEKRRREERESRQAPSTYPARPYYPYEPYQPYQAPSYGTYQPSSVSSSLPTTPTTHTTQQAHSIKKSDEPSSSPLETSTDKSTTKTPGSFYFSETAKAPIMREKKLKSEIIELINNLENNYKDKLELATTQPRPYPQEIPQLVETVEKDLGKIKEKQGKLAKVIGKFTNEDRKEKDEWKKQDEEYNKALEKLTPINNNLERLKQ